MPYPNEHAARQSDPSKYTRFARQNDKGGPGIDFIFGITKDGKSEIQSVRFDSSKFTPAEAKAWLTKNGLKATIEVASGDNTNMAHDAILQTLDRRIGGTYFTASAFEQNVHAWAGIPVVFAQEHPNLDAFASDPDAELARIKGKWVGMVENPYIAKTGHPRLMSRLNLIEDPKLNQLWADGKLSLSTAFKSATKDGKLTGAVLPNHVLVFEEKDNPVDQPKDPGTFILNKPESGLADFVSEPEKQPVSPDKDQAAEEVSNKESDSMAEKELEAKLEVFAKDYENQKKVLGEMSVQLKQKEEAVAARDAEITALKAKVEATEKAEKDRRWATFKEKLPEGMVHGEAEAKTRQIAETDGIGLGLMLIDHFTKIQSVASGPTGKEYVQGPAGDEEKQVDEKLAKLVPSVVFG